MTGCVVVPFMEETELGVGRCGVSTARWPAHIRNILITQVAVVMRQLDLCLKCRGKIRAREIDLGPRGKWIVFQVTGLVRLLFQTKENIQGAEKWPRTEYFRKEEINCVNAAKGPRKKKLANWSLLFIT